MKNKKTHIIYREDTKTLKYISFNTLIPLCGSAVYHLPLKRYPIHICDSDIYYLPF